MACPGSHRAAELVGYGLRPLLTWDASDITTIRCLTITPQWLISCGKLTVPQCPDNWSKIILDISVNVIFG